MMNRIPVTLRILSAFAAFCATVAGSVLAHASESDPFTRALEQGPVYAGLAAFASGFLVSLTPCVYPMVAVTVGIFGATEARSRWHGAGLSAAFVAGIVAMFVPLGLVAGLTGSLAGSILQSRWVVLAISGLFLAMAASMFGAFELDIPSGLKQRLARVGGVGYAGAFLLGLACGPIAAPCTGPFLTGILAWIAKTQSAPLGGLAMAAFALGLGVPFFLVGTFAVQLPKSGRWMVHVKSALGLVITVVALYFLSTTFPVLGSLASPSTTFVVAMVAVSIVGLFVGALHKSFEGPTSDKVRKGVGVVLTAGAGFLALMGATSPGQTLVWESVAVEEARARALAGGKPLIVDFTASWCGACKELDKLTFAEPSVKEEAGRFLAVKVDATNDDEPMVASTLASFGVVGLPTVVVFDSRGEEAIRYTDFVDAKRFLDGLRAVK
jgi:thioredoxin:protein disulfide reductase